MKKDLENLLVIRNRVDEGSFSDCLKCDKVCIVDNERYCTNKKCRSTKKRLYTRKKNIRIRGRWIDIKGKMINAEKSLIDNNTFPYLAVEAFIKESYNEEILSYIGSELGIAVKDVKKIGHKIVYKLDDKQIKTLLEMVVLRSLGYERAEKIVKTKIKER